MITLKRIAPLSATVAGAICVLALAIPSFAAEGKKPSAAELIQSLQIAGPSRGLRDTASASRLKALKDKNARGLSLNADERNELTAIVVETSPSVNLEVLFEFDSAKLQPSAIPTLDELGKALQAKQLKGDSFVVAGHTDAMGRAGYNQRLSEQRARTVKEYLVKNFNVPTAGLVSVGYGRERLKNVQRPYDGANRRVEIINMGNS